MGRKSAITGATGADIAGGRAAFYDLLVAVFDRLPDQALLGKIKKGEFKSFLSRCCELRSGGMDKGLLLLDSYQSGIGGRPDEEVLTELSVDRTKILRGTGHQDMMPPHEGLYRQKDRVGDSVLQVRRFYRKAGLAPDETVHEAPDYLCVELDFMKQLCLREQSLWLDNGEVLETVVQEDAFLKEHPGMWVHDFCARVERHALTDFYRGFSVILAAFMDMERAWLRDLLQKIE
jgi:putative dimethyl sulfoxide reductase chaperone